jgi:hypothetical protein
MTTTFEVHVEGELAPPTLHSLGCTHRVAEAQTMVRIEATPSELIELLKTCCERGAMIESIVRVDRT